MLYIYVYILYLYIKTELKINLQRINNDFVFPVLLIREDQKVMV